MTPNLEELLNASICNNYKIAPEKQLKILEDLCHIVIDFQYYLVVADSDMPPKKSVGHALEADLGLNIDDCTHVVDTDSVVEEEF